jgi:O-antigen ligase
VFIIVSCIPFLLGLIESYGEEYNLTDFGVEEVGFCGLFHSSHSCAWVVTITLFNLFYLFNISLSIRKRYWIALLILIGFFVLYKTYVRTGYLMFFIGCLFFFKNKIVSVKKRLKYILWGIIFVVLGYSYLSQDDVLMSRLTDSRVYNTDQTDAERLGSGRLLFISISIDYWMQAPFMVQLFGYGQEMAIQNMEEKMGLKVFSHNGFVDAFVQNGLIGLLLLIVILISFKKQINKIKGHSYYDVCNAIFFMYIAFQLVQGGYSFMFDFIIALNLSITMLIIRKIQPLKH